LAVLVEIDRDHALVDDLLVHERHRAFGALGDVVEDLAVQRRDCRWRAHHDQHLVLARTDWYLLERAGWQDIALLELLARAGAEQSRDERGSSGYTQAAPIGREATQGGHLGRTHLN